MIKCLRVMSVVAAAIVCTAATPAAAQVLSAGGAHTLGINAAGEVVAWGFDGPDHLGDPEDPNPPDGRVTNAPTGNDFIAVSAGGNFSVALRSDGTVATVVAWGFNGDPADGRVTNASTISNAKAVSAGGNFSLALLSDGSVQSWGDGGELQVPSPPIVSDPNNEFFVESTAIAAGGSHALALLENGTVRGWGGLIDDNAATPPQGLNNVIAISAGNIHSLALRSDGTVVGWGAEQEASGNQAEVPNNLGDTVAAISAGGSHSLALKTDGTVEAWGSAPGAAPPPSNSNVVYIDAGGSHNYAVKSDGSIESWGNSADGRGATPGDFELPTETNWATATLTETFLKIGASGDYLNSHRWEQGIPSTALSTAVFDTGAGPYTVDLGNTARALNLVISDDVTFNHAASASYVVQQNITVFEDAAFRINGTVSAGNTTPGTEAPGIINNQGLIEIASGGTVSAKSIVNNGTLTGTISITDGTRLSGIGILDGQVTIADEGVLAPGESVGLMTGTLGTNVFFGGNGTFEFEINDATGTAGGGTEKLGWDKLEVGGTLFITATSTNPFKVDIRSLSGTSSGDAANFNFAQPSYNWDFVTAADGIDYNGGSFDSELFDIIHGGEGFTNLINGGEFSISQVGNSLFVTYTAVPEPSSFVVLGVAGLGFAGYRRRRQRKDKLAEGDGKLENASAPSANAV